MYLTNQFIDAIKLHYNKAHTGNVNQLLEAINRLVGQNWLVTIQPDVRFMGWLMVASSAGVNHSIELAIEPNQDKECIAVACWANSLLSTTGDKHEGTL